MLKCFWDRLMGKLPKRRFGPSGASLLHSGEVLFSLCECLKKKKKGTQKPELSLLALPGMHRLCFQNTFFKRQHLINPACSPGVVAAVAAAVVQRRLQAREPIGHLVLFFFLFFFNLMGNDERPHCGQSKLPRRGPAAACCSICMIGKVLRPAVRHFLVPAGT